MTEPITSDTIHWALTTLSAEPGTSVLHRRWIEELRTARTSRADGSTDTSRLGPDLVEFLTVLQASSLGRTHREPDIMAGDPVPDTVEAPSPTGAAVGRRTQTEILMAYARNGVAIARDLLVYDQRYSVRRFLTRQLGADAACELTEVVIDRARDRMVAVDVDEIDLPVWILDIALEVAAEPRRLPPSVGADPDELGDHGFTVHVPGLIAPQHLPDLSRALDALWDEIRRLDIGYFQTEAFRIVLSDDRHLARHHLARHGALLLAFTHQGTQYTAEVTPAPAAAPVSWMGHAAPGTYRAGPAGDRLVLALRVAADSTRSRAAEHRQRRLLSQLVMHVLRAAVAQAVQAYRLDGGEHVLSLPAGSSPAAVGDLLRCIDQTLGRPPFSNEDLRIFIALTVGSHAASDPTQPLGPGAREALGMLDNHPQAGVLRGSTEGRVGLTVSERARVLLGRGGEDPLALPATHVPAALYGKAEHHGITTATAGSPDATPSASHAWLPSDIRKWSPDARLSRRSYLLDCLEALQRRVDDAAALHASIQQARARHPAHALITDLPEADDEFEEPWALIHALGQRRNDHREHLLATAAALEAALRAAHARDRSQHQLLERIIQERLPAIAAIHKLLESYSHTEELTDLTTAVWKSRVLAAELREGVGVLRYAAEDFRDADVQGVDLVNVHLEGVTWNFGTCWPQDWRERIFKASLPDGNGGYVVQVHPLSLSVPVET